MTSRIEKRGFLKRTIILLSILLVLIFALIAHADSVILKNGMVLNATKVWEENGKVKCSINGLIMSFSKEEVERIESDQVDEKKGVLKKNDVPAGQLEGGKNVVKIDTKPIGNMVTQTDETANYDLAEIQKRLDRKKAELESEYLTLMLETEHLSNVGKKALTELEIKRYNYNALNLNQNLQNYERKRKDYTAEVEAYKADLKRKTATKRFDEKHFSTMLESWQGRNISEFVDRWGYPDQIFRTQKGHDEYLFVIEANPSQTREVYFETAPSGEIVGYRSEVINTSAPRE